MFSIDATFLVVFFSFLVFMLIMDAMFFKPILAVKNERENSIEAGKQAAEEAARKTAELSQTYENQLAEARRKAQQIIQEKRAWAKTNASQHLAKAREQAHSQIAQQTELLKAERDQVYASLQSQRDDYANAIIEKLSRRQTHTTAGASTS